MAVPPARAPAQPPAPKRANGAAQPRPGDVHGIEIDSLVARARDASSRKAQTPMRHPPQSIPQSTRAAPTTPMPDLAAHGDRLKQVLDEIEQAAARAQNRSKTRPDRHGR
jgi:hypothetical protein